MYAVTTRAELFHELGKTRRYGLAIEQDNVLRLGEENIHRPAFCSGLRGDMCEQE